MQATPTTLHGLSHQERVRRALDGSALDRPPYSFWTHFPDSDLDPDALVRRSAAFARELDVDFVKSMPNGLYCVEDWGVVADYSEIAHGGVGRVVSTPIAANEDWRRIGRLPLSAPALSRELRHLGGLVRACGSALPCLATVFSPLTTAHKLAGPALQRGIAETPELVLEALERIALTTADFVRAALAAGCAGVFLAVQDADPTLFDDAAYAIYGEPFDRLVLKAAAVAWFNVLHMHGERVLFERLRRYPVDALNWHIGEAEPSLAAYRQSGGTKPVVGGLRRDALTRADLAGVTSDIEHGFAATGGKGILFAPGCTIRHPVDMNFLKQVTTLIAGRATVGQGAMR